MDTASSVQLSGASDHLVSEALYLRDPEENGVEIYRDLPQEEWPMEGDCVRMDSLPLKLDALRELGAPRRLDAPRELDGPREFSSGSPSDEFPAGTDIGHVHLEAIDLDATEAFYTETIGLRVRQRFGPSAEFFAAGDYHHHVGANTWNNRHRTQSPDGRGVAWYEIVVPVEEELAIVRARVEDAGLTAEPIVETGRERSPGVGFAVRDPNGVSVQVVVE